MFERILISVDGAYASAPILGSVAWDAWFHDRRRTAPNAALRPGPWAAERSSVNCQQPIWRA